jgi:DNA-binding IclR family transcriptional regulator
MRELAQRAQQSNHLAIYDRAGVSVIAQTDAPGYWGISIRVGARISLYNTGSGHVLLAFRSPSERAMMIAEHELQPGDTGPTAELEQRLDQIRARGYEVMPSLQTSGVYNLSAPILAADGHAIAALTTPYIPTIGRPNAPDMMATIALISETATRISAMAGGAAAETAAAEAERSTTL